MRGTCSSCSRSRTAADICEKLCTQTIYFPQMRMYGSALPSRNFPQAHSSHAGTGTPGFINAGLALHSSEAELSAVHVVANAISRSHGRFIKVHADKSVGNEQVNKRMNRPGFNSTILQLFILHNTRQLHCAWNLNKARLCMT